MAFPPSLSFLSQNLNSHRFYQNPGRLFVLSDERIHHHIMAEAPAHDKEMENFVRAEIFVAGVKKRQFQRVDDSADGIDDAACQKPAEGGGRQGI